MNPVERAAHPSIAQIHGLLNFLEKNPSLAKGFPKIPSARDAARKSWEKLTLQLNSLRGCVKTWKQWTKYWADKKSAVKKKGALRFKTRNETDGGKEVVELSEIEERILTLMGESCATGDRHLEISPIFEVTKQCSENSPSLLASTQLIGLNPVPLLPMEEQSTSNFIGDLPIQVENVHVVEVPMVPSPPCTPSIVEDPLSPSGSGSYPQHRPRNAHHQLIGSPVHDHSMTNTTSTRLRHRRRSRTSTPSQRRSQRTSFSKRLLAIEEQNLEINRRNSKLFERLVNETVKGIREGFQLFTDSLKK